MKELKEKKTCFLFHEVPARGSCLFQGTPSTGLASQSSSWSWEVLQNGPVFSLLQGLLLVKMEMLPAPGEFFSVSLYTGNCYQVGIFPPTLGMLSDMHSVSSVLDPRLFFHASVLEIKIVHRGETSSIIGGIVKRCLQGILFPKHK